MCVELKAIVVTATTFFAIAATAQDPDVKIGHVAQTSGIIAGFGKNNENAARLAVDELNARAVSIGGRKARFELVVEDDKVRPKSGRHRCADARRRRGQRSRRPSLVQHFDRRIEGLLRCRHPADLAGSDRPRIHPRRL